MNEFKDRSPKTNAEQSLESNHPSMLMIEDYLRNVFTELDNDYNDRECARIAIEIAKLLLNEGGEPQILRIRNSQGDPNLIPLRYNGRVKWTEHTVCENNGVVYDPLVGKPLPKDVYLATTFTEPTIAEVDLSRDRLRDFVSKQGKL